MLHRPVLSAALALALLASGGPSLATPGPRAAPARAVGSARPAAGSTAMVTHTGTARTSAPARSANGIAGTDLVRPIVRSAAGGASARAGGIDGGTVRRHY
jgi:hypothetical protein